MRNTRAASYVMLVVLAVFASQTLRAQVRVTAITCDTSEKAVSVRIACDGKIASFQKPERQGSDLIIRIVDAELSTDAVVTACDVVKARTSQIRNFFVLRLNTSTFSGDATIGRDGTNALVVRLDRQSEESSSSEQRTASDNWSLDVIVIDAGHGGKDVGAIGVNGAYEKDVTLALARKLRDRIKDQFPKTKVVMTRDSDVFIELFRRTQIANEAKGKLFISIHCNSMPTKPHPANGCETYILRPGRNDDAARVAALENASVKFESSQDRYKGMTEDQLIVATMAQRSFVRFSEELAQRIQQRVSKTTGLTSRGVNQAGFFVLVGASMPNILFETAFLSNNKDAAYISSTAGQNATAEAMMDAITDYATFYARSLKH